MKKNYKANFGNRILVKFNNAHPVMGSNAIASDFTPKKEKLKKKFTPRYHLEKIGGISNQVKNFISGYCDLSDESTQIVRTSLVESIENLQKNYNCIINLKRVNDIKEINKFFFEVNNKLNDNALFIGCVETKYLRRQRLFKKFPGGLNHFYYTLDFIFKRVFPKLPVTRRMYYWLTKGRNQVLSRTETLGRLYAAGFEVIEKKFINNMLYFAVKKVKQPLFNYEPVYGPIFKMRRHGKDGKIIHVYKMRTMHAYSEYIQHYVYEKNKLDEGGKMKDDFRVSSLGKVFRKYWIDELPMIVNFLRGELKIVGVRPLSSHYLSLYTAELKEKRSKVKPGLIPPFYVDMPKTIEEIMESEMKYLKAYEKHPVITDVKYFVLCIINIFFRKARSK